VGLLIGLAAASVQAQGRNGIEVNIPFDLAVGDAHLKAGDYIVDRVDSDRLVLTSVDGKVKVMGLAPVSIERARNNESARLVFHRYGDMYFLSEAWINGNGKGLNPSKAERRAGSELAKANGKPETMTIAAHAR
jgi:hypothetical protein